MMTRIALCLGLFVGFLAAASTSNAQRGREQDSPVDPEPRIAYLYDPFMRFGVSVVKDTAGKPINKELTYARDGSTNNTVVLIDSKQFKMHESIDKKESWIEKNTKFTSSPPAVQGTKSVWAAGGVRITQFLEIVPSQQPVEVGPGIQKRLLDTLLVRYELENPDSNAHQVGLRIMVDTQIGGNDGVPFTVPGLGLIDTMKEFKTAQEVPEFIQALEKPDLQDPGTIGNMTLKLAGVETPGRVLLTYWPRADAPWDVAMKAFKDGRPDSSVVIYWLERELRPGEKRMLGFAYGLGRVSSAEGAGKLALSVNGSFLAGEPFIVTAYVQKPAKDQTLVLDLPPGLERVEGKQVETVPPATAGAKDTSVVTWKVKAPQAGQFTLKVNTIGGVSQSQQVTIQPGAVVDAGKFTLSVSSPLELEKPFTLTAKVKNPLPKQTLTLELPAGLERIEGNPTEDVKLGNDAHESTVAWKVKASKPGQHTLKVRSSTGLSQEQSINIEADGIKPVGGGKFTLAASGPLMLEKTFTLSATIKNPLPKQTLSLIPPPGLERVEGDEQQSAPALAAGKTEGETTITWKIKAQKIGQFTLDVHSSSGDMESKTINIADVKKDFNLLDARRALQMSVGNLPEEMQYDVDSDGRVTSLDAAIILQRVAEQARKGK